MNEQAKQLCQRLNRIYCGPDRRRPLFPFTYTSIAFDWSSELGKPYEINIVMRVSRVTDDDVKDYSSKTHRVHFDERASYTRSIGSSESVGLIPKSSFYYDETKVAVFERNLADILMNRVYNLFREGESCILIQGPLFPKLAGRLGYRHLDRNLTVAAITYHPEWLPQVPVKSLTLSQEINSEFDDGCFFESKREKVTYKCVDIRPSNGLTESLRSWGVMDAKGEKRLIYAIDVFCQFPHDTDTQSSLWIDKLREVKSAFSYPGLIFRKGEAMWLPFGMACAVDSSQYYGYVQIGDPDDILRSLPDTKKYLAVYEQDAKSMYESNWKPAEIVGRRTYLYEALYETDLFQNIAKKGLDELTDEARKQQEPAVQAALDAGNEAIALRGPVLTALLNQIFIKQRAGVGAWKRLTE